MPSLRASGTGTVSATAATTTSLAVPIGTGVVSGDFMFIVAAWAVTGASSTYTTPTGWTVLSSTTDSAATNIVSVGTFYRVSDGTEHGTTVTVTHSTGARCAAVSAAFQSANGSFDGSLPAQIGDGGTAGTSAQTPGASPTFTNDLMVCLIGAKQNAASTSLVTWTAPTNFTVAVSTGGAASAGVNGEAMIGYRALPDASVIAAQTWTASQSVHWGGYAALIEDTSPAGAVVPRRNQFHESLALAVRPRLAPRPRLPQVAWR